MTDNEIKHKVNGIRTNFKKSKVTNTTKDI